MFKLNNHLVKSFIHFLRLVRWPNLLFILLAESLFHFFIFKPLYPSLALTADYPFYFIVATSICIAAAGYIINDYFDINIDQVNKPKSVVVGAYISRRWVIFWHLTLSMGGASLSGNDTSIYRRQRRNNALVVEVPCTANKCGLSAAVISSLFWHRRGHPSRALQL